jgi:hypothetical protein
MWMVDFIGIIRLSSRRRVQKKRWGSKFRVFINFRADRTIKLITLEDIISRIIAGVKEG